MASGTIFDTTGPTSWAVKAPRVKRYSGFWAGRHHRWEAAGYILASLTGLALVPALFVAVDHAVAVRWSNEIFDLVSLR